MILLIFLTTIIITFFISALISGTFLALLRTCDTIISLNLFTNQKLTDMSLAKMIQRAFTTQQPACAEYKEKKAKMTEWYKFIYGKITEAEQTHQFSTVSNLIECFAKNYKGMPGVEADKERLEKLRADRQLGVKIVMLRDDEMRNY